VPRQPTLAFSQAELAAGASTRDAAATTLLSGDGSVVSARPLEISGYAP